MPDDEQLVKVEQDAEEEVRDDINHQAFYDKVIHKNVEQSIEELEKKRIQNIIKRVLNDLQSEVKEENLIIKEDYKLHVNEYQLTFLKLETVI